MPLVFHFAMHALSKHMGPCVYLIHARQNGKVEQRHEDTDF